MFGLVITTKADLALSGARTHFNKTAGMSAVIEALSFLGLHGPVACDANSCIYHNSKHSAGVCLGTVQARPCNMCKATTGTWVMNVLSCRRAGDIRPCIKS